MTNFLKQIWSDFEGKTTRRLTGRGVENIVVPHRAELAPTPEDLLPEGLASPAETAFEALKARLSDMEKKAKTSGGKENGRRAGRDYSADLDDVPPAPLSADAYGQSAYGETPTPAMEMIKGLHETQMRIERPALDYGKFLALEEQRAGAKKKRKFLGIF